MNLEQTITNAWNARDQINAATQGDVRDAVEKILTQLDAGEIRVAKKIDGIWQVHPWVKQAILLSFRLNNNALMSGGVNDSSWFDKVPGKFENWDAARFQQAGFRAVPNCVVRRGAFIGANVVVMPISFINLGAYIDSGTMVDSGVTVGSCAQIGKHVHLSSNVMIGGVLEPLQANPTIIEDHCFIGAGSNIAEGMIIEQGAVISMGVSLSASTKIIDRETGEIFMGRVPAYSVVVSGSMPGKNLADSSAGPALYCGVIVKRVDEQTRSKTSINDLLRD